MPIGKLIHTFFAPEGDERIEVEHVGDWTSEEEAPGGQMAASGVVSREVIAKNPHIFKRNAVWRTAIEGEGIVRFGGRLLDPAPSGLLSARGWADIERKASKRFMPQTRNYSEWGGMDSEPFSSDRDGFVVAEAISVEQKNGSLKIKLDGSGQDPASAGVQGTNTFRYRHGLIAWFPGVDISRIAGRIKISIPFEPGTFQVGLYKGNGPEGPLSIINDGANPYPLAVDTFFPREFDLRVNADADMVAIILENTSPGRMSVQRASIIEITQLRVNGIGYSDEYPAARFVQEVFSRMNIRSTDVDGNGTNTLPFDLADNSPYAEALDYVNMLTGWRHRIVDRNGPHAEWGPWGPTWQVPEDQFDDFVPLERYDAVRIPFQRHGTSDEVLVTAEGWGAGYDVPVIFDDFALANEPNKNKALQMAHSILDIVGKKRMGGDGQLTEVLIPGTRDKVSAHHVQAGDILYYPHYDHLRVRVASLRRSHSHVEFTCEERVAALDRMVARYNRRAARRGKTV